MGWAPRVLGWVGPWPRLEPGLDQKRTCSNPHHLINQACHPDLETNNTTLLQMLVISTSISSLTSTYSPHWNSKCTPNTNSLLVTISRGDRNSGIPCVVSYPLRHSTAKYTRWMTNFLGRIVYGRLEVMALQRSLIAQIIRSIYPTCSIAVVVVILTMLNYF